MLALLAARSSPYTSEIPNLLKFTVLKLIGNNEKKSTECLEAALNVLDTFQIRDTSATLCALTANALTIDGRLAAGGRGALRLKGE